MREILFRAKTKNKHREWIIGLIGKIRNLDDEIEYYIIQDPEIENIWLERQVDPSTLGQYTGQIDKNGKRIFEGDIVKLHRKGFGSDDAIVVYKHSGLYAKSIYGLYDFSGGEVAEPGMGVHTYVPITTEVIGNIYDNPELLETKTIKLINV